MRLKRGLTEMADKEVASIPFFAHEAETARLERVNRRLWLTLLVVFLAFVGSNFAWIVYESQFTELVTTETYEASADGNGTAVANGEGGVTIYGNSGLPQDNSREGSQN